MALGRRTTLSASRVIAQLLNESLDRPENAAALANVRPWVQLSELIGQAMSPDSILAAAGSFQRDETLFKLTRIACDLANAEGGVMGPAARSWTRDLLVQRQTDGNPLERAVATALAALPEERVIAHAHVVFFLQLLVIGRAAEAGAIPSDGYLAFMMLAANDHLPEWPKTEPVALTKVERLLAPIVFASVFNRNDDALRSIVRIVDILGRHPRRDFPDQAEWTRIQEEAFGATFEHYAQLYLLPMYLFARSWGGDNPPIVFPQQFAGGASAEWRLYRRWFREASVEIDAAPAVFGARTMPSGLPGIPKEYFRTPFVDLGDKLLALSPWHMRDHLLLGTWAKLNEASKRVLATTSNQRFASGFGFCFEEWCADVARAAESSASFTDRLILPSQVGASDEIEDVVLLDGDVVVMMSAKASLVREPSLKTADSFADVIAWLRRFFFEDAKKARKNGYRGGAVQLLDKKVRKLRAGAYEQRGLKRDALVLPCVLSFDNVGESGVLYKWLAEERKRLGLLADSRVRPLTVLTPSNYEGLMALGARGDGVSRLLFEKTDTLWKFGNMDSFLYSKVKDPIELRLEQLSRRFSELTNAAVARLGDASAPTPPSRDDVALAAYYRWQARGCVDGFADEDWFEAERELQRWDREWSHRSASLADDFIKTSIDEEQKRAR